MSIIKFLHKWLGILMAPLMIMWFISGYFMIFSGFPRVQKSTRWRLQQPLSSAETLEPLPTFDALQTAYAAYAAHSATDAATNPATDPTTQSRLTHITMEKNWQGQTTFLLSGDQGELKIDAATLQPIGQQPPTLSEIEAMTRLITAAPPIAVDTLTSLNQWVPFGHRRGDLPFIKVRAADDRQTTLYFSGTTGELLQQTDRGSRLLAGFGTIPHWLYIWQIRQNVKVWIRLFIALGIIGCLMILSGLVLGIYRTVRCRRSGQKGWSPFRRKWYLLHHITGLLFGVVVLTWMFSGWMSLDRLPRSWTGDAPRAQLKALSKSQPIAPDSRIDFATVLRSHPGSKRITYANYMGRDYYETESESGVHYDMIESGGVAPLQLTGSEVLQYIKESRVGAEVTDTTLLTQYTRLYHPHPKGKRLPPLPALRVETAEGTTMYVALDTPKIKLDNRATRLNGWAYSKLHSFNFLWGYKHPTLWLSVMLILLTGGTLVSISGGVLGFKALRRKFRR
ncbi:MAG: PepSY domain-containing protein [Porphyromonas sp.]|nr:PepSY domain-containing protein [Porphyromonas sp.]